MNVTKAHVSLFQIAEQATRSARIKLDIEADSPILLIPESSRTDHVLVADLGQLRLTNMFIVDSQTGTLSFEDAAAKARRDNEEAASAGSRKAGGAGAGRNVKDMTESVFEHSYPPHSRDPMMGSIYGSLDEDPRYEGLEAASSILLSESDLSFSMDRGSSVDPQCISASSSRQADLLVPPSPSTNSTLSGDPMPEDSVDGTDKGLAYKCLLNVMDICLSDMNLFTAQRVSKGDYRGQDHASDMEFASYVVQIDVST